MKCHNFQPLAGQYKYYRFLQKTMPKRKRKRAAKAKLEEPKVPQPDAELELQTQALELEELALSMATHVQCMEAFKKDCQQH